MTFLHEVVYKQQKMCYNIRMKKILLCSLLIAGCTNVSSVDDILNDVKTDYRPPLICPELSTKVCNGPDKRTIEKYERHYCKCLNRRDIERSLENLSRINL